MRSREGLGLAQALVTLTLTDDHRTAAALASQYVAEYDPAELLVWLARYSGLVLGLLARADAKDRTPAELAEVLAAQIALAPDEAD
ncbi:hypothetical protein K6U06_10120 [Acidiferrimicrobium sp. IK]|uniref:hypothetical protein n=1 Tax=Acidiferrimicrobium sp. IK TaxID=2871700 RepID=UPI0021CB19C3|nr:hypothetical protein [Acidiferrimicrobium sp. IK]MCU4184716.1 hypothetical protein [Acidiferrimicrobium sp. IK]